jgi:hypothetical protein
VSLAEVAGRLERDTRGECGHVLEEAPAEQHVSARVIAGDDGCFGGADHAEGNHRAMRLADGCDDALAEESLVVAARFLADDLTAVAD